MSTGLSRKRVTVTAEMRGCPARAADVLIEDPQVRVGWCEGRAVGRHDVLRTGREHEQRVHFGAQRDTAARRGHRGSDCDRAVGSRPGVLEQVQRARRDRDREPDGRQRGVQVVGAVSAVANAQVSTTCCPWTGTASAWRAGMR
jgi:hypothetical protein